jgi:hypothetical protein
MRPDMPIAAFALPNEPEPGRTPHGAAPPWRANEPATPENPNEPEPGLTLHEAAPRWRSNEPAAAENPNEPEAL